MTFEDLNWHAGLLLKPQHFQHIKLSNYFNIFNLLNKTCVGFWGVLDLSLDTNFIQEGKIVVSRVNCLCNDGSIVDYNASLSSEIFEIDLNSMDFPHDNQGGESIVYLCVVKNNPKEVTNSDRYYFEKYGPIKDSSGTDLDEHITRLKVKPYFLSINEIMAKHETMPLFAVKKVKSSWSMCEFIPPLLYVSKENQLVSDVIKFLGKLEIKLEVINTKIISSVKQQYLDYNTFISVRRHDILASYVYELKTLLTNNKVKPVDLHCKLNTLLAKLYICANEKVKNYPLYDHNNILRSFDPIVSQLNFLVENVLIDSVLFTAFDHIDNNSRGAVINRAMLIKNMLYIQCATAVIMSHNDILTDILGLTITSKSMLNDTVKIRVSGIKRSVVSDAKKIRDLTGISSLENVVYIELDVNNCSYFNFDESMIIFGDSKIISRYSFSIIYLNNEKS